MKKLLLASLASLTLASATAFAADMPLKAPPPAPVTSWTGCYVSGGVGYGMWNQDTTSETLAGVPITAKTTLGGRGWLGRLGAGCDYQLGGGLSNWVIGAFGDYDFMNIKGTWEDDFFLLAGNEKESSAWYAGGRIGYLVTPSLMTYVDGGWTATHFDAVSLFADAPPFGPAGVTIPSHTYSGWFIGGGTEYALNMPWIPIRGLFWRTEYRFSTYQSADLPLVGAPGFGDKVQKDVQTITSSLVWRFNWPGPIATRY